MTIHRYPLQSLIGDYLRAAVGVAIGLGVLLSTPPSTWIVIVFGGLFAVFSLFALRTLQRQITKVAVTEAEISDQGLRRRQMAWSDISQYKLRFYGNKRKEAGKAGFMQLKIKGAGATFAFESNLEGFDHIALRAAQAARQNGVTLDPASIGNLKALGYEGEPLVPTEM